ncbi:hypothetical protein [Phytohabitans flavus]|uniref:hypothetical protein n=1 Tax=Phytohabitans flavus TaxID=1076124 RepID=UPI001565A2FF|nr:hypothetical protein [Phytohabitans flavus]
MVAAGAAFRVLAMIGYSPGFWFFGDSTIYVNGAYTHVPNPSRPYGYSFVLSVLSPLHSVRLIIGLQHLLGLAVAILMYAFLRRRDLARWLATIAVAPILLDARTVLLEHFLIAESLFIALLVGAVIALCWSERPGWWAAAGGGTLLAAAALTRTIALPLVVVVALYLLVRRAGLLRVGAFAMAFAIPLAGYAVWYEHHHGTYSLGTFTGRFMWARTMSFVDCAKVHNLTARERQICPPEPLGERRAVDLYIWSRASPAAKFQKREHDAMFASFARKAIMAQPLDYARTVAVETWFMVRVGPDPDDRYSCFDQLWSFPTAGLTNCQPIMAPEDIATRREGVNGSEHRTALTGPLHTYSQVGTLPATFTALCLLLAIAAPLVRRWRRVAQDRRDVIDGLFLTGVAFGMIVISVATSVMEPRYTVPSIPLAAMGAALALRRGHRARAPEPTLTPAAAPAEQIAA